MKISLFFLTLFFALSSMGQNQTILTSIKGTFALKNVYTGKYVRIKDAVGANGTPIVAYYPENWKCMTWEFQANGSGGYILKNLFSGKTLVPIDGKAKEGIALEEQPINSQLNQQYEVITAGKDQYRVRLKGTNLFITPSDPHGSTNSSIILQPEQQGNIQLWTLVEQHPTM